MSLVDEVCDAKPLMMQASIPPALLPQSPRSWINYRLPAINVLPSLLNHFLELRAENIHASVHQIAAERRLDGQQVEWSVAMQPQAALLVHDINLLVDNPSRKPVDRHMHPVMLLPYHDKFAEICFARRIFSTLRGHIEHQVRGSSVARIACFAAVRVPRALRASPSLVNVFCMSLAEIEKAVDELSSKELTKLATYIAQRDKLAWDREIEEDFSPGGKHEKALEKIDAEIDSGNFTPPP